MQRSLLPYFIIREVQGTKLDQGVIHIYPQAPSLSAPNTAKGGMDRQIAAAVMDPAIRAAAWPQLCTFSLLCKAFPDTSAFILDHLLKSPWVIEIEKDVSMLLPSILGTRLRIWIGISIRKLLLSPFSPYPAAQIGSHISSRYLFFRRKFDSI